jgi:hypothetical protein
MSLAIFRYFLLTLTLIFGSSLFLSACSSTELNKGDWILFTESGQYGVHIEFLPDEYLYLRSPLNEISGRYKPSPTGIVMVPAEQPRVTGIVFKKSSKDLWIVTRAPSTARMPVKILGARLSRIAL